MSTPTPSPGPAKGKKKLKFKIPKKSTKQIQEGQKKPPPALIGMRSETQCLSSIDENDRAGRIDVALGMVMEDMKAIQGQAIARNTAVTLNTQQMKEHVGRLCDEATRRRKECAAELLKTKTALSTIIGVNPSSGLGPIPMKVSQSKLSMNPLSVKSGLSRQSPKTKKKVPGETKSGGVSETSKSLAEILSGGGANKELQQEKGTKGGKNAANSKGQVNKASKITKMGSKTTKADLDTVEANAKPGFFSRVQLASPGTSAGVAVIAPPPGRVTVTSDLYQTSIDLRGFANDNISLDLDGRRVVIVAYRSKDKFNHARKVTEIIEIPGPVKLESLKITRRADGWLTIEEVSKN